MNRETWTPEANNQDLQTCSTILLYFVIQLAREGLLLADGAPTVGRGKTFWQVSRIFFTETAVTPEQKVEKSFPRWEINRHAES